MTATPPAALSGIAVVTSARSVRVPSLCGMQHPGTCCRDLRCWSGSGEEVLGKGSPIACTLPCCHCHQPQLVAVPQLSGMTAEGGAGHFPPTHPSFQGGSSWLEQEWSRDLLGKGACWGQAALPSHPAPSPSSHSAFWGQRVSWGVIPYNASGMGSEQTSSHRGGRAEGKLLLPMPLAASSGHPF